MKKDIPLNEITLRKYEKPYSTTKRELMKKICLSLGLLQSGDSRDVIVDILLVLDEARKIRKELTSDEIKEKVEKIRQENSLEMKGIAESNMRRQLKRLRDLMLVEKNANNYSLSEFLPLNEIFQEKIENFLIPDILKRVKEHLEELEKDL